MARSAGAQLPPLPDGDPVTLYGIESYVGSIYRFFVTVSVVLAVLTLVVSGIMWATAGDSNRIDKAKGYFKSGIIGAAILLGIGVIIATLNLIINQRSGFFNV